jgi:uncharacterized protein YybS (DUF2232 family)
MAAPSRKHAESWNRTPHRGLIVGLALPAVSVLLGMAWYKLTSRRNCPFEPTLWCMFRWTFIIFVLIEVLLANLDNLLSFDHSHPMLFALGTGLACVASTG